MSMTAMMLEDNWYKSYTTKVEQVNQESQVHNVEQSGRGKGDGLTPSALDRQCGGDHYKRYNIQPVEFCQVNKIPYCESNIIKYLCRWRDKGGSKDLEKARHYLDLLMEIEVMAV